MTRVLLAVAATVVLCAVGCNGISRGNLCCANVPGCSSPGCSSCSAGGCSSCAANSGGHRRTGRCCHAYSGSQYAKRANQSGGMGNGGFMNGGMGQGGMFAGGHGGMMNGGMGHGGIMGPGGITACQQCGGRLGIIGNTISCRHCGIGYGPVRNLAGRVNAHLHPYAGAPTSTPPFAGNSGPSSAQVAYPYYTTRGPRDFLMNNPATIGR